jgi:hypothetical protein
MPASTAMTGGAAGGGGGGGARVPLSALTFKVQL